ncbi:MAG: cytochrome c biogenesis protein [Desulfobacterales bacterium]|nr:cytochrome c biogenesis protein [Desulfobacterales bacterium]
MRETLSLAGWAIAGVFILLNYRYKPEDPGGVCRALRRPDHGDRIPAARTSRPRPPQLFKSFWLVAHVTVIFIGEAAFALACGVGILYLIQENSIKTKKRRFFFKRLPSLDLLDSTGYACIVVGFTLLTHRAHHRAGLRQIGLGPVLELGPQGGVVGHLLAVLRRPAARAPDGRLARPPLGHHGDRRLRRAAVHLPGGEPVHGRAITGSLPSKGFKDSRPVERVECSQRSGRQVCLTLDPRTHWNP